MMCFVVVIKNKHRLWHSAFLYRKIFLKKVLTKVESYGIINKLSRRAVRNSRKTEKNFEKSLKKFLTNA